MTIILITGGTGFLGINLLQKLISPSVYIILIDNFITSNKDSFEYFYNSHPLKSNIKFLFFDITSPFFVSSILTSFKHIDYIYHFASLASPPHYKKHPLQTLDVGYLGTKNVLDICKHFKCKFLYTSSSEVYGDSLIHPQSEKYYGNVNTVGERSCYDESKRISETLVYTYTKLYNLDTRIVRIFNTYGPYMRLNDGRIITEIINSFLNNTTLYVNGNGSQTRCFNYVDDTINMILKVMHTNYKYPINIGNNNEISINQLIEISKKVYQKIFNHLPPISIHYTPIDIDDPKIRKPDLSLNKEILGNYEFIDLEKGLENTFLFFNNK